MNMVLFSFLGVFFELFDRFHTVSSAVIPIAIQISKHSRILCRLTYRIFFRLSMFSSRRFADNSFGFANKVLFPVQLTNPPFLCRSLIESIIKYAINNIIFDYRLTSKLFPIYFNCKYWIGSLVTFWQ